MKKKLRVLMVRAWTVYALFILMAVGMGMLEKYFLWFIFGITAVFWVFFPNYTPKWQNNNGLTTTIGIFLVLSGGILIVGVTTWFLSKTWLFEGTGAIILGLSFWTNEAEALDDRERCLKEVGILLLLGTIGTIDIALGYGWGWPLLIGIGTIIGSIYFLFYGLIFVDGIIPDSYDPNTDDDHDYPEGLYGHGGDHP